MRIFFLSFIFFAVHTFTCAQNQKDEVVSDSSKLLYFNKAKEMNLKKDPNFYYKYKVNLLKYNELKDIGVDLKDLDRKAGVLNYKEYTLVSNYIVEGVILSKVYDNRKDVYFHSSYKILIKQVIKGEISKDTLDLKIVSGMLGDRYLSVAHEPEFNLGERVILFLDTIPVEEFNEARKKGLFGKILNGDASSYILKFKITDKGRYLYGENERLGKTQDIKNEIKKIIETNS